MKTDDIGEAHGRSTERGDQSELADVLLQHRRPDLDVDGWEPSLLQRLLKYLDPKNK